MTRGQDSLAIELDPASRPWEGPATEGGAAPVSFSSAECGRARRARPPARDIEAENKRRNAYGAASRPRSIARRTTCSRARFDANRAISTAVSKRRIRIAALFSASMSASRRRARRALPHSAEDEMTGPSPSVARPSQGGRGDRARSQASSRGS